MGKDAIQKQALEFIFAINAAATNLRLYPPTSALIINSMDRLSRMLKAIFEQVDYLEYAESEKAMLVQGDPLPEKEQGRSQINAFLRLMLDLGIRSFTIKKGVTIQEISQLLNIFGKSPKDIEHAGGLNQILKDQDITNIRIDEKIYIGLDSDHRIMSAMDLKDEDFAKFILGEKEFSQEVLEQIRELAKDQQWISRVFQAGVKQVIRETQDFIGADVSEKINGMMDVMERVSGGNREEIARTILGSMADMDDSVCRTVLSQNLNTVFGENNFQRFIDDLDNDQFQRLLTKVKQVTVEANADSDTPEHQVKSLQRVFQLMISSEKAKTLYTGEQILSLKSEVAISPELMMLRGMTKTVDLLISKGNVSSIVALHDRLGRLLLNKEFEVRTAAAKLMYKIDTKLKEMGRLDERIHLSRMLTEWIGFETEFSPVYEQIASQLAELAKESFKNDRASDVEHILNAYSLIYSNKLPRKEEIQTLATNILRGLATEEILDILIKDTRADGTKKQDEDINSLVMLGTISIERLLDRLYGSHSRSERNRIVQVLTKIGKPTAEPITERLRQAGPWYYIRNLIMLLGRTGDESHISVLEPLLTDKDARIQREAVFSMINIGGKKIGQILSANLYSVDDDVKTLIISGLGSLKYHPSVPQMIEALESQALGKTKKAKNDIMAKICEVLGRMGANEAVPALQKVAHSKGFLSRRVYDQPVRNAAFDALAKFKNK